MPLQVIVNTLAYLPSSLSVLLMPVAPAYDFLVKEIKKELSGVEKSRKPVAILKDDGYVSSL
jgi:hypothetical protein